MPTCSQTHINQTIFWIVSILLLSSCGSPLGPIPGGKLKGEVSPWPANWDHAEDCENVLLETDPCRPLLRHHLGRGSPGRVFRRRIITLEPVGT